VLLPQESTIFSFATCFQGRDREKFETFRKLMNKLFALRRQFLTGALTQEQINDLKMRITANIDWGNRTLGLDLVPRIDCEIVDPSKINVLDLFNLVSHTRSFFNPFKSWKQRGKK
jgi:hypothetical protein